MNKNNVQIKKSRVAVQSGNAPAQDLKVLGGSELSHKRSIKTILGEPFYLNIVEIVREPLLVLDPDLGVLYANRNFYKTNQITARETIGSLVYDLGNGQWDIPELRILLENIFPQKTVLMNINQSVGADT